MRTIELNPEVNRWDELVAAYRSGETVEIVAGGRAVGRLEPNPASKAEAAYETFRQIRERGSRGGGPIAVEILRELRAE